MSELTSQDKREEVAKIFDNGVSCSDGQTHFLDESQKRYITGQIYQLFTKQTLDIKQVITEALDIARDIDLPRIAIIQYLEGVKRELDEQKDRGR